jgi:osmotically-inducible protein OsmY/sporulation protein YlmC with PRC-barrel domain
MPALTIGSEVRCSDGTVGKLSHVVLDKHTSQVTHLVVETAKPGERFVVPMELVREWEPSKVTLAISGEQLRQERLFVQEDFAGAGQLAAGSGYGPDQALVWQKRYGDTGDSVPELGGTISEAKLPGKVVIGRGARVYCEDGPLGIVDHVLLKPSTGEVTHIVVRRGALLGHSIVVPVEKVRSAKEEEIRVEGRRQSLLTLPTFSPPADEAILSEVRQRLRQVGADLRDAEVSVSQGLVRLTGSVRDVRAKRRAESIARGVEGVVGVDNALTVDSAVAAAVVAALARDPRTRLASIEVTCDRGVVTLAGSVDTPGERVAAEEVARQVPGVLLVVNGITVQPDLELPIPPYAFQAISLADKAR